MDLISKPNIVPISPKTHSSSPKYLVHPVSKLCSFSLPLPGHWSQAAGVNDHLRGHDWSLGEEFGSNSRQSQGGKNAAQGKEGWKHNSILNEGSECSVCSVKGGFWLHISLFYFYSWANLSTQIKRWFCGHPVRLRNQTKQCICISYI